jgi:hypothetical protein
MANAPRPGASRRAEAEAMTITIKVDGAVYTVRPGEVTANLVGQLRRVTGFSLQGLMAAAGEDPDLDVIAALVWMARRQAGENVNYEKVADSISYESDIESQDEPEPEDPASPEA